MNVNNSTPVGRITRRNPRNIRYEFEELTPVRRRPRNYQTSIDRFNDSINNFSFDNTSPENSIVAESNSNINIEEEDLFLNILYSPNNISDESKNNILASIALENNVENNFMPNLNFSPPNNPLANSANQNNLENNSPTNNTAQNGIMSLTVEKIAELIPSYNGEFTKLEEYLATTDLLYHRLMTSEENKQLFLIFVRAKLINKAFEATRFSGEIKNWDELKIALKNNISRPINAQTAHAQLMRVRQKANEDIKSYSNQILDSLYKLNQISCANTELAISNHIKKANEGIAKQVFEDGIYNERVKIITISKAKISLKDTIDFALEQEQRVALVPYNAIRRGDIVQFLQKEEPYRRRVFFKEKETNKRRKQQSCRRKKGMQLL